MGELWFDLRIQPEHGTDWSHYMQSVPARLDHDVLKGSHAFTFLARHESQAKDALGSRDFLCKPVGTLSAAFWPVGTLSSAFWSASMIHKASVAGKQEREIKSGCVLCSISGAVREVWGCLSESRRPIGREFRGSASHGTYLGSVAPH